PRRRMTNVTTSGPYDLDRSQLDELLEGEPRYRVDQVWDGLYRQARPIEEMTDLPKGLRARLAEALPPALTSAAESVSTDGRTIKWLWRLHDGVHVETVLMHYQERST